MACGQVPIPVIDKEEVFWHIYNTELHHEKWECAKTTYLVYTLNQQKCEILRNTDAHAEEILIKELLGRYERKPMYVNVYINNSPCSECTQLLLDFLLRNRQVRISIHAASLYNINRRSCMMEKHKVSQDVSDQNSDGLRNLTDHNRCEMRVFDKNTWRDLIIILGIVLPSFDQKYEVATGDRSRKIEDERLKDDLDYICQHDKYLQKKIFTAMFYPDWKSCMWLVSTASEEKLGFSEDLEQIKPGNILIHQLGDPNQDRMQNIFMTRLREFYMSQKWKKMHVTIYMNRSPSEEFARSLLEFLKEKRHAVLHIYAANLYKMDIQQSGSNNYDGLRSLMDHTRCTFTAFNKSVWKCFLNILGISRPEFDQEYMIIKSKDENGGFPRRKLDDEYQGFLRRICDEQ